MNICLIGSGISTLILANVLANRNIKVSIYEEDQPKKKLITRTLGISKNNFDFLINEKINIKRKSWSINKIKIFNEIVNSKEILNFVSNNNDEVFFIIKYEELINLLSINIKKNKFIKKYKIKNSSFFNTILDEKDNYDLIFNFNEKNKISKFFFFNKTEKDYNSIAYTYLINHEKCNNNIAHQIFTKFGPLAFLPCSKNQTSVVFSILNKKNIFLSSKIEDLILKYNRKYKIKSFSKLFFNFGLKPLIIFNLS